MKIHFLGVGGISMQGLAQYSAYQGHDVSGCDLASLDLPGVSTVVGHDPSHIEGCDLLVYSSAVKAGSPGYAELAAAEQGGVQILKRAELIGQLTRERPTITVSGMHGKSTTTGMVAHILTQTQHDPLVMIGAPITQDDRRTYRVGRGPLVLEADEFDRSFLAFTPKTAIITNIEAEHLDYYTGGLPEIIETFSQFMSRVSVGGTLIVFGDDVQVRTALSQADLASGVKVVTYGFGPEVDYQISESVFGSQTNRFTLRAPDGSVVPVTLSLPGKHNQANATAALLASYFEGVDLLDGARVLADFTGVGQRFELLSTQGGVTYVADYAHHPTEVAATIAAARAWYPDQKIVVVFQPHQYSRTKLLFTDFIQALATADQAIVTDIFAVAGRDEKQTIAAEDLVASVNQQRPGLARYCPVADLAHQITAGVKAGDVVLLLGAGRDITRISQTYRLGSRQ